MSESFPFLAGGGEAARMIRERDWRSHPLGPPEAWPDALRSALSLVLNSPESMILAWGPELHFFFNDTYFPLLGPRLSWAMGERFDKVWADGWEQARPIIDEALAGRARRFVDLPWKLGTDRGAADTWWTFSYSRVLGADGALAGLFILTNETTDRVLGEAALRASEERLRLVVEGARDHAILTTDPAGSITSWSAGAGEAFGWSPDEAIGQPLSILYTPEDRTAGADRRELETAAREGRAADERWHVAKGGGRVFMSGSVHPLRGDAAGDGGFIKIARDDTARRRTAEALRESEERFRNMADHAPVMMWVTDPDGACTYLNRSWYAFTGQDAQEALGFGWLDAVHPEDRGWSGETFLASNARREAFSLEYRLRAADGSYRWAIDAASPRFGTDGAFLGYIGSVVDITARKAAEAALERENRLLEGRVEERTAERDLLATIVETTDSFVHVVDLDYRWLALNKAGADEFERVFGVRPRVGDRMLDLLDPMPEVRAQVEALWAPALGGEEFTTVTEFTDPAGRRSAYELKFNALRNSQGERVGAFQMVTDVSERLAEQERLRSAEEALRQSQKMEAVGQLTGGLAHDFNNLLAGISGSLELIEARVAQGRVGELDRYLVAAQGAARRAAALTHRLLAFSRRQTLDPRPTNINVLVAGMEELIRRTVGPSIRVETVAAGAAWPVLVDPNQLENALLNLCINARDAMPNGGRLTIETGHRWLDERAARACDVPPGPYVSMCVGDDGTGMAPEVIERAMEPFFTTKPIGVGTGLGLSMIYGFARQSGGQVRIESEVGRGTTVCLHLPRHLGEAEPEEARAAADRGAAPARSGESVLVIDDEPLVRMLVVDVLEDLGYSVLEAGDGPSGLTILRSGAVIDLLVTDVGLPNGLNGRQVADAARALRPGLKVLFVTGYAENAVLNHGHLGPGMHVVTKPFNMEDLGRRIAAILSDA